MADVLSSFSMSFSLTIFDNSFLFTTFLANEFNSIKKYTSKVRNKSYPFVIDLTIIQGH